MSVDIKTNENQLHYEEIVPKSIDGMGVLISSIVLYIASIVLFILGIGIFDNGSVFTGVALIIISLLYFLIIGPITFIGLKVLKPNEALVLTLFGKYYGTLKGAGFFFVNPFTTAVNTSNNMATTAAISAEAIATVHQNSGKVTSIPPSSKKISLKAMTLNNDKQKINDQLGNPIIIGIVVIWKVVNTAKAVF